MLIFNGKKVSKFLFSNICLLSLLVSGSCLSQESDVSKVEKSPSIQYVNPESLYDGSAFSLSQGTIDTELGLVFVSGQVDWSKDFSVNNTGIEAQTASAMKNLKAVLENANSSIHHLLKIRIFVRGELHEHMDKVVPEIVKHLEGARPALTGVGVYSLASPDTLIEIEAVAKLAR